MQAQSAWYFPLMAVVFCMLPACGTTSEPHTTSTQRVVVADSLDVPIAVCEEVQRDRGIPIGCAVRHIRGRPVMMVTFADARGLKQHVNAFATYLAGPFCEAAIRSGRDAYLLIALRDTWMGSTYSCSDNEMSDWVDLDRLAGA